MGEASRSMGHTEYMLMLRLRPTVDLCGGDVTFQWSRCMSLARSVSQSHRFTVVPVTSTDK